MDDFIPVAAVAVCLSVVVAISYHVTRILHSKAPRRNDIYRDDDGEASVEGPHGQRERMTRLLVCFFATCALTISLLDWVLHGFRMLSGMISSGWIAVFADAVLLILQPNQKQRFTIGWLVAIAALALSTAVLVRVYTDPQAWLVCLAELSSTACLALAACSLRRRPNVYFGGRPVDAQYTCSAIQRVTFSWVRTLLDQARTVGSIEYDNLAALDHATRARELKQRFPQNIPLHRALWLVIIRNHGAAMAQQWIVAIVESIASMLPPVCMFQILAHLEKRASGQAVDSTSLWSWVICLAGAKVLHVFLSNWLQWVSFALFAIPVRSQLSAVIFNKSLNMRLVQGTRRKAHKAKRLSVENEDGDAHEMDTFLSPKESEDSEKGPDAGDESDDNASKAIMSLLGVDVQRVAEFCGYNMDLLRGLVKIIISACLLASLLGWWSTMAGFAVPLLLQPLNRVATKYYSRKQLEVMEARDGKAHVVTEALLGIRQIKFSASEAQWEARILAARERELVAQWRVYVWAIFLTFVWIAMPSLIGAAALSVYAWVSQRVIASVAFTALSIFSSLEWTISAVPTTLTEMLDAKVSAERINRHLRSDERVEMTKPGNAIEFKAAAIAWPSEYGQADEAVLRDLNLRFPEGALSVIQGKTGAGKSLLLAAIIGEADLIKGEIFVPRAPPMNLRNSDRASADDWIIAAALAYVSQVPWIENTSVKNAILFGLPYRRDRYTEVLRACALLDDIQMLPDGENTEIGATGINISGGQRWRLALARALYSRAGIVVLDDIFSAVDSHVGRHLLDNALLGSLGRHRTIIIVTHHIGLVHGHASYIVQLRSDGTAEVEDRSGLASEITIKTTVPQVQPPPVPQTNDDMDDIPLEAPGVTPRKFVEDETRAAGRVKWEVYRTYLLASGGLRYWLITLALFSIAALSNVARSYWLALWTKSYTTEDESLKNATNTASSQSDLVYYLSIYILISMISVGLVAVKIIFVLVASLRAARQLFETTTLNVLRARLRWLDTQPTGRILNRFVGDFALIDSKLGGDLTWCANGLFSILTIITAALFVSLWMIVPVAILSGLCIYVVYLYLDAARDIKRLESNAKSPIYELLGSTLTGLATIRSFGKLDDYLTRMYECIDRYAQSSWYILLATQWMTFRQGILGVAFTMCIAVGVAYFDVDASLAGFALSFALDFSAVTEKTISRYTSTELDMNSMERVMEYMHLKTEPASGQESAPSWPSQGALDVRKLTVGYAENLDPVLTDVSFAVQSHQRIGIVGRTGSGKSSLTLALFRFLEARSGAIRIDGVDIATVKLHDLRSRLAIIPQDPVLFSGTLRSNLDPFDEHSDGVLLDALDRVNPEKSKEPGRLDLFKDLSSPITQGGSNLSQGEKQLVCLARAMVSRPRVLILDEATSAVDMETDSLIQRTIRQEFSNSTLLVVAHRLSTVADFDRILVLSEGRVVEYDRPETLARTDGPFRKMLEESGEQEALAHLLQQ